MERLQARDSLSEEEAWQRINAQMPLEEKCRKADIIVDNSWDRTYLKQQVLDLSAELNRISLGQKLLRAFLIFLFMVGIMYLLIISIFNFFVTWT